MDNQKSSQIGIVVGLSAIPICWFLPMVFPTVPVTTAYVGIACGVFLMCASVAAIVFPGLFCESWVMKVKYKFGKRPDQKLREQQDRIEQKTGVPIGTQPHLSAEEQARRTERIVSQLKNGPANLGLLAIGDRGTFAGNTIRGGAYIDGNDNKIVGNDIYGHEPAPRKDEDK